MQFQQCFRSDTCIGINDSLILHDNSLIARNPCRSDILSLLSQFSVKDHIWFQEIHNDLVADVPEQFILRKSVSYLFFRFSPSLFEVVKICLGHDFRNIFRCHSNLVAFYLIFRYVKYPYSPSISGDV